MNIAKTDLRIKKLKELEQKFVQNPENNLYIWGAAETAERVRKFIEGSSSIRVKAYVVDDEFYDKASYDKALNDEASYHETLNNEALNDEASYHETFYDETVSGSKQPQDASDPGIHNTRPVWKASDWQNIAKEGDAVWVGFVNFKKGMQLVDSLPEGIEGIFFSYPISGIIQGKVLTYEYYQEHKDCFEWLYSHLADEKSKRTLEGFLNGCISGDALALEREHTPEHYFNDITRNYPVRCLVDCGAYTGDSITDAADFYADTLDTVIAFEPDQHNMNELKKIAGRKDMLVKNWNLIEKGSWNEKTELRFKTDGQASCVNEDGEVQISVDTIDHVLKDLYPVKVDFIKMDVEGSEKESLLGACETIKKDHPILAVSIYHKIEDLCEIPQMIESIGGG